MRSWSSGMVFRRTSGIKPIHSSNTTAILSTTSVQYGIWNIECWTYSARDGLWRLHWGHKKRRHTVYLHHVPVNPIRRNEMVSIQLCHWKEVIFFLTTNNRGTATHPSKNRCSKMSRTPLCMQPNRRVRSTSSKLSIRLRSDSLKCLQNKGERGCERRGKGVLKSELK